MEDRNIVQITTNCFIIYTQAGFNKLCRYLHCYNGVSGKETDNRYYRYYVIQNTGDANIKKLNYPASYPCILSYMEEKFEVGNYYFYIRYIPKHMNLDSFQEADCDMGFNRSKYHKSYEEEKTDNGDYDS